MSSPDAPSRELKDIEILAYQEDGVVCLRDIIPQTWISKMQTAIDNTVQSPSEIVQAFSRREEGFTGGIFLWKQEQAYHDFLYQSPVSRIAMSAMQSEHVNSFFDQIFVKQAGCLVPTPWHQDLPYWPLAGNQICSIWVPFDPVTKLSSGLEFISGSHKWSQNFKPQTISKGAIDGDLSGFDDMPDIEGNRQQYDIVSWDLSPGDALLFHGRIVHGASGNTSLDTRRRALATRWAGTDIRWDPRPGTLRLLWEPGLESGSPLGGKLFPQIAPNSLDSDRPAKFTGAEPPLRDRLDELLDRQKNNS